MNKYINLSRLARRSRAIERGCLNKVTFETEESAYQKGQQYYRCKNCGKWHRSGKLSKFIARIRNKKVYYE